MSRGAIKVAALCAVLVASTVPAHAGAMEAPAATTIEELRAQLRTMLQARHIPGMGLALVTREGVLYVGGIGQADREKGMDVVAETRFAIGSITKSFVGLAALRLVEQGKLSLDAKLDDLAPEIVVTNPWSAAHPITLAHLLEHTAGFADTHFDELLAPSPSSSLAEVLSLDPRARRARWPPGVRVSYSNPGYTLAGYVLEKATGQRFERLMRELVLDPLGMPQASFIPDSSPASNLARGYRSGQPVDQVRYAQIPAGNLLVSPAELAHLVQMWLGRGQRNGELFISAASVERAESTKTLSFLGSAINYGLGNFSAQHDGILTRGHNGSLGGFSSSYRYASDLGIGWVLLFNASDVGDVPERMQTAIVRFMMRNRSMPTPAPTFPLRAATFGEFTGYYRKTNPRDQWLAFVDRLTAGATFQREGEQLKLVRFQAADKPLIPTGPRSFRVNDELATSIIFDRSSAGPQIAIIGLEWFEKAHYWPVLIERIGIIAASLFSVSSLPSLLVWCLRWLVHRRQGRKKELITQFVVTLPTLCWLGFLATLIQIDNAVVASTINSQTLLCFCLTILLPALSLLSLYCVTSILRGMKEITKIKLYYILTIIISNMVISGYFIFWGLFGLRLWTV